MSIIIMIEKIMLYNKKYNLYYSDHLIGSDNVKLRFDHLYN